MQRLPVGILTTTVQSEVSPRCAIAAPALRRAASEMASSPLSDQSGEGLSGEINWMPSLVGRG